MSCVSTKRLAGALWVVTALLGVTVLSGCDTEYPSDLKYGLRTDSLIQDPSKVNPPRIDKPGEFPNLQMLHEPEDKGKTLSPTKLSPAVQQSLEKALTKHFGTPYKPLVVADDNSDVEKPAELQNLDDLKKAQMLDDATLAVGSAAYRLQCLHCHGLTGNGRGPTAPWVNPHPRDYRSGLFKFTSTAASAPGGNFRKPSRHDLLRTLREGIEGTSMPTFGLLPERELEALVSYVIHLSLRGDVEYRIMQAALSQDGLAESEIETEVNKMIWTLGGWWMAATNPKNSIRPEPATVRFPPTSLEDEQAVRHGFEVFTTVNDGVCRKCHVDFGRQALYFYDNWGNVGRPADLTQGVYRGGRRPIDLYYRIHSGIPGSNMPELGNVLSPKDIWDVVSFLQVLPNPSMRKAFNISLD